MKRILVAALAIGALSIPAVASAEPSDNACTFVPNKIQSVWLNSDTLPGAAEWGQFAADRGQAQTQADYIQIYCGPTP